jgi:hypothetical protein
MDRWRCHHGDHDSATATTETLALINGFSPWLDAQVDAFQRHPNIAPTARPRPANSELGRPLGA